MKSKLYFLFIFFFSSHFLKSQDDSAQNVSALSELSLEQLMNTPIYSVSKTEESSFDAPLSSTVVTRDEIKKAGCTSIMEALRLVPGVIVQEQSNGNYAIYLRGLENVPPNSAMYFFANSTTLVMIDNRPVYNYLHGGTFWETLPVDLNDVEKIEVVRGPSAAMYGPNAVSGVINIITRRPEKKGLYLVGNAQYGNYTTGIANASVGYKFNDRFSAVVSGNFQNRNRTQSDYYDVTKNKFVPLDSFVTSAAARKAQYPDPNLAMRKYGYNAFFNYKINDKANLAVRGGGQNSEVQDEFASSYLTTAKSNSYYADLMADVYGIDFQASYLTGTQSPQTGVTQWKWNLNTLDLMLDYNFTLVKHLTLTPGISYRSATYDDGPYVNDSIKQGFFNGKVESSTLAAFLRADYTLFHNRLRLIAAGRMDKFNAPDKIYYSWQLAATYKLTPKHLLRIVESRANRAPLLADDFINVVEFFNAPPIGVGSIQIMGNRNLQLLTTDMLEFGYRGKLKDNLEVDIEVFGTYTRNFSNIVFTNYDSSAAGTNIVFQFQNLAITARQIGGTISFNYVIGKFQVKPFITVQNTTLFNYSPYAVSPNAPTNPFYPNVAVNNTNSGLGTQMNQLGTPSVYGGAYINFQITRQLNLNLNPYFMSASTQLESSNLTYNDGQRGVENITPKFIMNVAVSYTFFKKLSLFANFKNCLSDKTREFYKGDIPGFKISGGASFEF